LDGFTRRKRREGSRFYLLETRRAWSRNPLKHLMTRSIAGFREHLTSRGASFFRDLYNARRR